MCVRVHVCISLASPIQDFDDNMLCPAQNFPLTNTVARLMQPNGGNDTPYSVVLDPRYEARSRRVAESLHLGFSEVIVFVLGGGNYAEFQNLQDFASRTSAAPDTGGMIRGPAAALAGPGGHAVGVKTVVYGSTEMLSPEQFLSQLARLGAPKGEILEKGSGLDLR